ncbi:hypothetical protein B0A50_01337 [Salinomyces thailandicus]|uniref:DUF2828 domain-containing protein n=1 Tax=Salinomyces thailandicus TaxID=706561 RepID=A0A4U0U9Q7_9PEZI|nr:hypothetical protein B0A50_01337 [Salinomyces thailandica]
MADQAQHPAIDTTENNATSATNSMIKFTTNSMVDTNFPVLLPSVSELLTSRNKFEANNQSTLHHQATTLPIRSNVTTPADEAHTSNRNVAANRTNRAEPLIETSAFMEGLKNDSSAVPSLDEHDGKMLTDNADVAYQDSGSQLVDAFFEIEDVISGPRLRTVLDNAWAVDPDATLKIIWNARSIHIGKASRHSFLRAVGWLAEKHPITLLTNLPWLVRPLIRKKALTSGKARSKSKAGGQDQSIESEEAEMVDVKDGDSEFEIIDDEQEASEGLPKAKKLKLDNDDAVSEFDVKFGLAHGYWKDLLNILAVAVNNQLKVDGDPRSVLNVKRPPKKRYHRDWTEGKKKIQIKERHDRVVHKLQHDPFYSALHLTVAVLFADQLRLDLARLHSGRKEEMKQITLAAKWAPSHKGMHDQHTTIVTTIAELLYPFEDVCNSAVLPEGTAPVDPADRETYLKYARQAYQLKTLSPLRKAIHIVERPISANDFDEIKYERVPSLAMNRYTELFAQKDEARFDAYLEKVAQGRAKISGATMLPSVLVSHASRTLGSFSGTRDANKNTKALVNDKIRSIQLKSIGGQWEALVQRIKESGTLESAIAVCDVSGSMQDPKFPDGTCPMDSAIGLSLLLAEVTKPPFGGAFITFSASPEVLRVGGPRDKRSFEEKIDYVKNSVWSMNTDFVAVFDRLILPMAVKNKLKQEDMVKQVFVFSDMQFDAARGAPTSTYYGRGGDRPRDWNTSYDRIKAQFAAAGYEMPQLVFWNLAGGRAGKADTAAPKPVTAAEKGTSLVSGYGQGQLKMFLDNGEFEDPEDEVVDVEGDHGEVIVEMKKAQQDPLATVRKAISHAAYRPLKVVD